MSTRHQSRSEQPEQRPRISIRTGDNVLVTTGKDRGKQGTVLRVDLRRSRVVVEGVNMMKKHLKPTPKNPHGGIVELSASLHASNVALLCSACGKPTRIRQQPTEQGTVRVCKVCGEAVSTKKQTRRAQ